MKKNILILISSQYSAAFISAITGILITRYLGVIQTGQLGLLQTIFALLGIVAGLGQISAGNILMLRSKKSTWQLISKISSCLYIISSSIFCLFIFIFLYKFIDEKLLYAGLSFSLITGGIDIFSDRWELEHKSSKVAKFRIYNGFVTGILRIIGALLSLELYYFCFIPGLARLLPFYFLNSKKNILKSKNSIIKNFPSFKINIKELNYKSYLKLGFVTGIESLLLNFANRLDILMLSNLSLEPLKAIGIFVGANKFFLMTIPIATTIATSVAGKLHEKNSDQYKLNTIYFFEKKFPKYIFLSILISLSLLMASPLFEYLLGNEFEGVKEVSIALSLGYLPLSLSIWTNKQLKIFSSRQKSLEIFILIPLIGLLVNFILNYFFIHNLKLEALGAAIATTISYLIKAIFYLLLLSKYKSKFIKN